jgi:hypothetical protein
VTKAGSLLESRNAKLLGELLDTYGFGLMSVQPSVAVWIQLLVEKDKSRKQQVLHATSKPEKTAYANRVAAETL